MPASHVFFGKENAHILIKCEKPMIGGEVMELEEYVSEVEKFGRWEINDDRCDGLDFRTSLDIVGLLSIPTSDLNHTATVYATEKGLLVFTTDTAFVVMCRIMIPKKELSIRKYSKGYFTWEAEDISMFIKKAKGYHRVSDGLNPEEVDTRLIYEKDRYIRIETDKMSLITTEIPDLKTKLAHPKVTWKAEILCQGKQFISGIMASSVFDVEIVKIAVDKNGELRFESEEDHRKVSVKVDAEVSHNGNELPIYSYFSVEFLKYLVRHIPPKEYMLLKLGANAPLFVDVLYNGCYLEFGIAPRWVE